MTAFHRWLYVRAAGVAVLAIAGCLALPWPRAFAADRLVPFRVGEELTYDVGWSNFVSAGTLVLSVKERRKLAAGRAGYYCVAEARPSWLLERLYHLYYKADAVIDTATLLPDWAAIYSDERGNIKNRFTRFVGGKAIEFEELTSKTGKEKRGVPATTVDALSAIYFLRAMPLAAGRAVSMTIADGGDIIRLRSAVAGPEPVATALGTLPAWRLTPALTDEKGQPTTARDLTLWISNDARRLPLRLHAGLAVGSVTLTIAAVK